MRREPSCPSHSPQYLLTKRSLQSFPNRTKTVRAKMGRRDLITSFDVMKLGKEDRILVRLMLHGCDLWFVVSQAVPSRDINRVFFSLTF